MSRSPAGWRQAKQWHESITEASKLAIGVREVADSEEGGQEVGAPGTPPGSPGVVRRAHRRCFARGAPGWTAMSPPPGWAASSSGSCGWREGCNLARSRTVTTPHHHRTEHLERRPDALLRKADPSVLLTP